MCIDIINLFNWFCLHNFPFTLGLVTRRVYSTRGSSNDRYTAEFCLPDKSSFSFHFGFGFITMTSPFAMPSTGTGSGQNQDSAQHGNAEQWSGTVFSNDIGGRFGMTPPSSPRASARATSPRTGPRSNSAPRRDRAREQSEDAERDRERDRDRRRRPPREDDEQPLPTGWGVRMLAAENKIKELQTVIESVNEKANVKIDQMKGFVQEVEGRCTQLERAVPERFHNNESRQENVVGT